MKQAKRKKATLPKFHDPVARYLAEHHRKNLDGTVASNVYISPNPVTAQDFALMQMISREVTGFGLS